MGDYVDPLAVTRSSGPDPLAVTPPSTADIQAMVQANLAAAPGQNSDPNGPKWLQDLQAANPGVSQSDLLAKYTTDAQAQAKAASDAWYKANSMGAFSLSDPNFRTFLGAAAAIAAPGVFGALGGGSGATTAGLSAAGDAGAATGALGAGTAAAGAGATVSELVVTAAAQGLSIPAIAASIGIPAATVSSILSSGNGMTPGQPSQNVDVTPNDTPLAARPSGMLPGQTVPELAVTAPAPSSAVLPIAAAGAGALGLAGLAGSGGGDTPLPVADHLAPVAPSSTGPLTTAPPAYTPTSSTPPGLLNAIKSGDPTQIGSWITANPLQAVQLGLLASSALATVTGAGNPSSSGSGTYKPVDLPASFSATSPHFALAGRGDPRIMPAQDWTKYGQGPEQSFFTGITQPAPITNLTVAPSLAVPDHIGQKGYARGGFAVKGAGDGRSDSIPARLSDGEYVMDAETVALLGNGSNKAGADKLDQFRVNLRKDKGRSLARGDFSVSAKAPSDYMVGAH